MGLVNWGRTCVPHEALPLPWLDGVMDQADNAATVALLETRKSRETDTC